MVTLTMIVFGIWGPRIGVVLSPGRLIWIAVLLYLFFSILMFTINIFRALKSARGKDANEAEKTLVPAMRGELPVPEGALSDVARFVVLLCLGMIAGAVILLAMKYCNIRG